MNVGSGVLRYKYDTYTLLHPKNWGPLWMKKRKEQSSQRAGEDQKKTGSSEHDRIHGLKAAVSAFTRSS